MHEKALSALQPLNIFTTTHIVTLFIVFTLTNMLWVVFQQSRTDTLFNTESTLLTWSCYVIFRLCKTSIFFIQLYFLSTGTNTISNRVIITAREYLSC